MSERTLRREFQKALGVTPMTHWNVIRIRHAESLLLHTPQTITEIALSTGFTDSNYFSRIFRKLTTRTPRGYRLGS